MTIVTIGYYKVDWCCAEFATRIREKAETLRLESNFCYYGGVCLATEYDPLVDICFDSADGSVNIRNSPVCHLLVS